MRLERKHDVNMNGRNKYPFNMTFVSKLHKLSIRKKNQSLPLEENTHMTISKMKQDILLLEKQRIYSVVSLF